MRSRSIVLPFLVSLVVIPAVFAVVIATDGQTRGETVTKLLFAATVVLELIALTQVVVARRLFSSADPGRLTWTLIMAFLVVRLVAEARLTTMNFHLVPRYEEGASGPLFFYVIVLRYLYTASDLLFIAALVTTIRAYKGTGLTFNLLTRDYVYMAILWTMPVLTFIFRDNLIYSAVGADGYIATYRLVAVSVGALIASLCLVVRRYVLQMGGGAVARVWSTVVAAGIARAASFLALALITSWWREGAGFTEQYLLWVFAGCWLIAAVYQQEVVPDVSLSLGATTAQPNTAASSLTE
jgi:hypothetical protein